MIKLKAARGIIAAGAPAVRVRRRALHRSLYFTCGLCVTALLLLPVRSPGADGAASHKQQPANRASQNSPPANAAPGAKPDSTAAGNAANGKQLFTRYGCFECHGHQGQGGSAGARLAPRPIPLAAMINYVRHPIGQMPPYTAKVVTDAEVADIYAFLQTIPAAPKADTLPMLN